MILQSQANWGAIERVEGGKRLVRKGKTSLYGSPVAVWLIEAYLRNTGRPTSITAVDTSPVLYPFELGNSLAYLLSNSPNVEVRTDSTGSQIATLAV